MYASRPLTVVIAPSGFKESLDADAVAQAIAEGVRRVVPSARTHCLPLVDGGEGTAAALAAATGGDLVPVIVTGPIGLPVRSHFAVLGDGTTAVVEMAAAAGLRLVPRAHRNPLRTTTRGVGELIAAALDRGCRRILVGCGDSGTSDGGAGALAALGARLLDEQGRELGDGARHLRRLARIDVSGLDDRLADTELRVACNPTNVLTGPRGVAPVFGPQKGASPAQVGKLAKALKHWATVLEADVPGASGRDLRRSPGTGASGGLGAGLAALGATLIPRFEVLSSGSTSTARSGPPTWSSPRRDRSTGRPLTARCPPRSPGVPGGWASRCSRWLARSGRARRRSTRSGSTPSNASSRRRSPSRRHALAGRSSSPTVPSGHCAPSFSAWSWPGRAPPDRLRRSPERMLRSGVRTEETGNLRDSGRPRCQSSFPVFRKDCRRIR
jgi:glycerate kinase